MPNNISNHLTYITVSQYLYRSKLKSWLRCYILYITQKKLRCFCLTRSRLCIDPGEIEPLCVMLAAAESGQISSSSVDICENGGIKTCLTYYRGWPCLWGIMKELSLECCNAVCVKKTRMISTTWCVMLCYIRCWKCLVHIRYNTKQKSRRSHGLSDGENYHINIER